MPFMKVFTCVQCEYNNCFIVVTTLGKDILSAEDITAPCPYPEAQIIDSDIEELEKWIQKEKNRINAEDFCSKYPETSE